MRRIVPGLLLAGLSLTLSGCGGGVVGGMLGYGSDPNRPVGNSPMMRRALGEATSAVPLRSEPGNVWPRAMPAVPTLSDLQKQTGGLGTAPAANAGAAPPGIYAAPGGAPGPNPPGAVMIPNGNGTSTLILPDGSVKTVPTPKP
ncbi:MAG: hypothetical protein ACP5NP_13165 [Acetobacteraceae bacterium]